MNNYWLSSAKKKKMLKSIDDLGMEAWSSDENLGQFMRSLSKEQKKFFLSMQLADFSCDVDQDTFRIELVFPG